MESVDKPGSVVDDHSSATNVTVRLKRPTNPPRVTALDSYLVLLRAGFTIATAVTSRAVRSYRTFSPLPASRRFPFCCTFRRFAPPGVTWRSDPLEPGLSSAAAQQRSPDQLAREGSRLPVAPQAQASLR